MATISVVAEYPDGYQFVAPLLERSESDRHDVQLISIGRLATSLLTSRERCIGINKVQLHRKEEFNSLFSGREDYFLLCMPQSDRGLAAIRQALLECSARRKEGDEAKILLAVPPGIPFESALDLCDEQSCSIDYIVTEQACGNTLLERCSAETLVIGRTASLSSLLRRTAPQHALP